MVAIFVTLLVRQYLSFRLSLVATATAQLLPPPSARGVLAALFRAKIDCNVCLVTVWCQPERDQASCENKPVALQKYCGQPKHAKPIGKKNQKPPIRKGSMYRYIIMGKFMVLVQIFKLVKLGLRFLAFVNYQNYSYQCQFENMEQFHPKTFLILLRNLIHWKK